MGNQSLYNKCCQKNNIIVIILKLTLSSLIDVIENLIVLCLIDNKLHDKFSQWSLQYSLQVYFLKAHTQMHR